MQDERFADVARRLDASSPLVVDGTPYTIWLIELEDHRADSVLVTVGVKSADRQQTAVLNVDPDRLSERTFPKLVAAVLTRIIRGDLTPVPREVS